MRTAGGDLYCYHFNATGSTVALTNATGGIVNSYAYDPFGNVLGQQESVSQPFKFVGQYGVMAEANGSLYYMRARYYDPRVGRFISEDPIGFAGGDVNLYGYVQNDPVNGIDPYGLITIYSGYGCAAYNSYGNKRLHGSVNGATGVVMYSDKTGWFGEKFLSIGSSKSSSPCDEHEDPYVRGGGAGMGPVIGFQTGSLEDFQGLSRNLTIDIGLFAVTFSSNDTSWGFSVGWGGKGFGLGYYINKSDTATWGTTQPFFEI